MNKPTRILKKIGLVLLGLLIVLSSVLVCLFLVYTEEVPEGKQPKLADPLAVKMLEAINHEAYKNTRYIEWTFVGQHQYKWDKQKQVVDISWNNYSVHLNTQYPDSSIVLENDVKLTSDRKSEIITQAVSYFNNDSFWLVAPHKIFDPGTERKLVDLENGDQGLLVSYSSGGNTPGDSYLWILDKTGLPKAFKMWVSIIPLGGLEASWDSWKKTESGALLPQSHELLFLNMDMGEVKAYNSSN